MYLIDHLHQHGIGVILDWVPSHFPTDEHGLAYFDGTHLYEHADPRQGFHPDWSSYIFNYGRHEVRSFLISQRAVLARQVPRRRPARGRRRLDALPRLLAQGRASGSRTSYGGRENLEAIDFLRAAQRRASTRSYPGRADDRRGVDRLADGVAADRTSAGSASASSGTWAGCTTRCSTCARDPVHRKLPPQRAHLPHALRLHRELRAAAVARRGRARQGLAARQDAGRRLAEVRQPAAAVRLHVRAAGQEAAVHGRRARPVARVEPRRAASTGTCWTTPGTRRRRSAWSPT